MRNGGKSKMKISILPQNKQKSIVFANLYKKVNLIGFCDLKYKLDISLNFSSCKRYPILPIRLISTNFLVYLMKEFELFFLDIKIWKFLLSSLV